MTFWDNCLECLQGEINTVQFNSWIRPLQAVENEHCLQLLAPNRFVVEQVNEHYLARIREIAKRLHGDDHFDVAVEVGSRGNSAVTGNGDADPVGRRHSRETLQLNPQYIFENFIQGKSNQLARAASMQVAASLGRAYNPLFICGGVGLGKTHLMHAIGHHVLHNWPEAKIAYLHSERFVTDMVQALQHNTIDRFKRHYRSLNALLIDDIQFFTGKERSQEEFFHAINALLEGRNQVVLTCDRYPREVEGLAERLTSRFGSGLTVVIEPPDLETRMAILKRKAEWRKIVIPDEACLFIAKHFRSNIRELEGALNRVIANAGLNGTAIDTAFVQEALKDLLLVQDRQVTLEHIQKICAQYFNIRQAELLSKRRSRSVARPRQMAMALAKELTQHSLPEIGDAFGGRDHTTVMHACRRIEELRRQNAKIEEDYVNLSRLLS